MAQTNLQRDASLGAVYAEALLQLAEEAGQLTEVADEIEQLVQLLKDQPTLRRLLENRMLSAAKRAEAIEQIFHGRVHDVLHHFLLVINERSRLDMLDAIFHQFAQLLAERRGLVDVAIYTASPLDAKSATATAQRLGESLGKKVVLQQYVDPSLIGGLRLRVGDQLIDGSVATQLKQMRRQLVDTARQRV